MPDTLESAEELADEPFRAPIVAAETVYEGTVWNINRDRFAFGGGELVREYQAHPGAVAVLVEDDRGRVLLIKQYRHAIGFRDWELPAGLLDIAREPPLDAAKRELAEEADLEADEWAVLAEFFSSPGGSSEAVTIYRARGLRATEVRFDRTAEEAEIEARWMPLPEVVAAVLEGRLRNSILAIAVLNAHARR